MSYQLFDIKPQEESESILKYIGRTAGRTIARGAEAALGFPGDIASTVHGLGNLAGEFITGKEKPLGTYEQFQEGFPSIYNPEIEKMTNKVLGLQEKDALLQKSLLKPFPTTAQVREKITEPLTGEKLKPKTSGESGWDQIVEDTVALFNPVAGGAKAIAGAGAKALVRSGLGNAAKWGTETMTDSPFLASAAKIGTNILTGIHGARGQLNDIKDQSYKDAIEHLPENAKINVNDTRTVFQKLKDNILKGDNPDKKDMLERIDSFFNNVSENGEAAIEDLINLKQGWNRWLQNKDISKDMRALIKRSVGNVNDEIAKYGKTNPAFFKPYKIGEELTAGMNSQNLFQSVIKSHPKLEKFVQNPYLQSMLFYSGAKHLPLGTVAKYAIPALGLNEASKVIQLISKSPTALNHYGKMLTAAGRNNIPVLGREMQAFDKAASKELNKYQADLTPKESQKGKYVLYS